MTGFSKGRELDDKNGDRAQQEYVHHAAFVKENRQHEPNQKQYSRYKPKFHVFPFALYDFLEAYRLESGLVRPRARGKSALSKRVYSVLLEL